MTKAGFFFFFFEVEEEVEEGKRWMGKANF